VVVVEEQNLNGGVLIDEKENIVNSAGIVASRELGCYWLSSPGTCPCTGASTCPCTGASTCPCTGASTGTGTNANTRGGSSQVEVSDYVGALHYPVAR